MFRRLLIVPLITATALALASCRKAPEEVVDTTGPMFVRTETAMIDTIRATILVTGTVAPSPGADWTIVAPENGRVAELPKAEGDLVKVGDLLVRFDVPFIAADVTARQSELAQANARLQSAKANASRVAALYARGITAQREHDDARREQQEAEAAVTQALAAQQASDLNAASTVVKARFDGVVLQRWRNVGDQVTASSADPILRVIDATRLEVIGAVPAAQAAAIRPGNPVRIMNPIDGTTLDGTVVAVPPAADANTPTVDVRVALPKLPPPAPATPAPAAPAPKPSGAAATAATPAGPTPPSLAVGTPVQFEILSEERAGAIVVPTSSLVRDGALTYVMIAGSDGKAHRKTVVVGVVARERAQIVSGVSAGERVIVAGTEAVTDGATITIQK